MPRYSFICGYKAPFIYCEETRTFSAISSTEGIYEKVERLSRLLAEDLEKEKLKV